MKKAVFTVEVMLSDGDYCLTQDPVSKNLDTYSEDIISTKIDQEAYILEELPEKDNQVFIYIPEFDYGAYMLKEFVKEVVNE